MNQLNCEQRRRGRTDHQAVGAAAWLLWSVALPAVAQQSTEAAPPSASATAQQNGDLNELSEVVVTARRRAESLSDVPETVNAIGQNAIIERGIGTEADLQSSVPGLIVRSANTANLLNFVIRGESVDAYSGSPPGVQSYIDEVPIITNTATELYDLENIQVVKGPQGTLFGRNATGGAVLLQTQEPGKQFGGYLSTQYGNFDRFVLNGAVDLPIYSDKVLLRVAGTDTSGGAFVRNLYTNQLLGNEDEKSGRATLELRPTEQLMNLTTVQYSHIGGTNTPDVAYYVVPCGQQGGFDTCNFSPTVPAFNKLLSGTSGAAPGYPSGYVYPGGLAGLTSFLQSRGPYVVDLDSSFGHKAHSEYVVNTTTWEVSSSISLKNIFGYSYSENEVQYDDDHSPYPLLSSFQGNPPYEVENTRQYSDELQLQGKSLSDRLTYMIGFFYFKSDDEYYSPIAGVSIVPPDTIGTFAVAYHALTADDSYAVFGQAIYRINDQLNLTVGGRGTLEELSVKQLPGSVFGEGNPQSTIEKKPSWTASLDYHLTQELMMYLTTRGSWRRGGFNPFAAPVGTTVTAAGGGNYFLPETVRDVEVGAKFNGHVGDMPLQANADAYHSWITDLQKTAYVVIDGNAASAAVNVPKTEISGVEGDVNLLPARWLRLGGTFSYNAGKFTQPQSILFGLPATFGPFGDISRFSGTLYGELMTTLPDNAGKLTYHTDAYAQTSFYFSNLNSTLTPGTRLPGYGLVNMRLDWSDIYASKLTGSLFVKNLADKVYYTGGNAAAQNYSIEAAAWGMPRTYGFSVRYDF